MIKTLDQTGDINGQQLYSFAKQYKLPPFVKLATSTDIYGADDMGLHQYANPTNRQFPCHTAAATYVSTLFFLNKKAEFTKTAAALIETKLEKFAKFHGITQRITELKEKLSKLATDITPEVSDFALIIPAEKSASGKQEYYYPLRNALEVKKAADFLYSNRNVIPYKHRNVIANKILSKAAEYGASLDKLEDFIEKQAGHGAAASYDIASLLFDRARLLKQAGKKVYAIEVGKLALTVAGKPETIHDNARLVKLASLIDDIDRETGLNKFIEDLINPEDVFFNITEKVASKLRETHLSMTSGNVYAMDNLANLKLADVRDTLGEDIAEAVSTGGLFVSPEKLAEIAPTLPRGDAELFDRLLQSMGIYPVIKEAAHNAARLDHQELAALATLHKNNH